MTQCCKGSVHPNSKNTVFLTYISWFIAMQIVSILCGRVLRYPAEGFLLPPKHSGGEGNLVCAAHSSEKLHFKNLFFFTSFFFFWTRKVVPLSPFRWELYLYGRMISVLLHLCWSLILIWSKICDFSPLAHNYSPNYLLFLGKFRNTKFYNCEYFIHRAAFTVMELHQLSTQSGN